MEYLPEDCVLHIIESLVLRDQIAFYRTFKTHQTLLKCYWQKKYRNLTLDYYEIEFSLKEIGTLIKNLAPTIQSISLINSPITEIIEYWNLKKIRCVLLTHFEFMDGYDTVFDKHIEMLTKIFPNLRVFSLVGHISGKYFTLWDHLEELTLTLTQGLKIKHFKNILEKFNLKSLDLAVFGAKQIKHLDYIKCKNFLNLEKIRVNGAELRWITDQLEKFNNLEELTITTYTNIKNIKSFAEKLSETKGQHLLEAEFQTTKISLIFLPFSKYNLLRKITIYAMVPYFEALDFDWKREQMPQLREFVFFKCDLSVEWLVRLLRVVQLERISVVDCYFDVVYVKIPYKDIIKSRSKPITLNFLRNNYSDFSLSHLKVELQLDGKSPLFIVTEEEENWLHWDFFKFAFRKETTTD